MQRPFDIFSLIIIVMLLVGALVLLFGGSARAHDAPTGWTYPLSCCSGIDCREVNTTASGVRVTEKNGGYLISTTGEWIAGADAKIRPSPDGVFHWCSVGGKADTKTICLFVPPSAY